MLADAEAGRFDVVVVHKLDRFARNLRVTLETLDRLERAGVGFVSITENMDFSTPMGRVVLTTMGGFAQFYSDNLSTETKKGKRERKAQGLYNGLLPFGVTKGRGLAILDRAIRRVPHPGIVRCIGLRAGGRRQDRPRDRQALNAAGLPHDRQPRRQPLHQGHRPPHPHNRFYLGRAAGRTGRLAPGTARGARSTQRSLRRRSAREQANTRRPLRLASDASPWALSGLATCSCGASMRAYGRSNGKRRVQCVGRTERGACDEPSFFAHIVEDQIGDAARDGSSFLPASRSAPLQRHGGARKAARSTSSPSGSGIDAKAGPAEASSTSRATSTSGEYREQKAAVAAALAALPKIKEIPTRPSASRLVGFLADLPSAWQVATPAERNKLARQLFVERDRGKQNGRGGGATAGTAPFFETLSCQVPDEMTRWRKRRDSNPRSQP